MENKRMYFGILTIMMVNMLSFSVMSCNDDTSSPEPLPLLQIEGDTDIKLGADGNSVTAKIEVTTENTDWEVSTSDDWLRAKKTLKTISISADKNPNLSPRMGQIYIKAVADEKQTRILNVTQEGQVPFIHVNGSNTTSLSFSSLSGINYKQQVKITSNINWTINNVPDWLSVSPTNGNGEVTVDIYPKTNNDQEDVERATQLVFSSDDGTKASIEVRQETDLDANAYIKPTNIVTLYNGIAFDYDFGKAVSYYYRGYMEKAVVGSMTDSEILNVLENSENFKRYTPADKEVAVFSGLDEGKSYMVYSVGYNKDGKRGKLSKTEVTTKTQKNNEPLAWISNPTTDGAYWYWSIEKSATCYSYYMYTTEDFDIALSPDVYLAWIIDYNIRQNYISEYVNGGNWNRKKTDSVIAIITWGRDLNRNFASKISWNFGLESSSSRAMQKNAKQTIINENYPIVGKDKITIHKIN